MKRTKRSKGGAFGKGGKPKQRPKFAELPPDCQKIVAHLLKCFSEGLSQEICMDDGQVQQSMIELFDRGYFDLQYDEPSERFGISLAPQPSWKMKVLGIMGKTGDWHLAYEEYLRSVPEEHRVTLVDRTGKSLVVDRRDLKMLRPEKSGEWLQQPS
jgi:hypothetical protein